MPEYNSGAHIISEFYCKVVGKTNSLNCAQHVRNARTAHDASCQKKNGVKPV